LDGVNARILVVARGGSVLNRFEQASLVQALNIKDFLLETGDYEEVSIFQHSPTLGPEKEWVKLQEVEC
jgi:hypothetical protein